VKADKRKAQAQIKAAAKVTRAAQSRRAMTAGPKARSEEKAKSTKVAQDNSAVQVYTMAGAKGSTIALPPALFDAQWKPDLVHQVTTAIAANLRQNRAHTKDRSEVSGGGKKPWKQKGTGQARHGSSRSPIWRHGGVTFGPRAERNYSEKINKKMRVAALVSALSKKARDGEIIFVDSLSFATPSTSGAIAAIGAIAKATHAELATKRKNAALFAFASYDANAVKSFRNIGSVATEEVRNLNPLDLLTYKYLVIEQPQESFKILASRAKSRDNASPAGSASSASQPTK
jgi:large subunit ribosomal protein L4